MNEKERAKEEKALAKEQGKKKKALAKEQGKEKKAIAKLLIRAIIPLLTGIS